jgi:PAS domain S-box-containing protein
MRTSDELGSDERAPAQGAGPADDSARLGRIVRIIAWAIVVGAIPSAAHNLRSGHEASAVVLIVGQIGALAAVALVRRKRLDAAIALLVAVVEICAGVLVVVGRHGFHDVAMLLFPATLVVAGLMLRRGAFAAVAAATVAFVLAIGWAEMNGLLVTDLSAFTYGRNLVDAAIILGVTAVAVSLLAESVRSSLARARENEAAAAAANQHLLEQTRRLQASEERFRALIDLAVDGIVIGDAERNVSGANRRVEELTGRTTTELIGRPIQDLFVPEETRRRPLRFDALEAGQAVVTERSLLRADGTSIPVEVSSKKMPDGTYQSFIRDISERRRAEEEQSRLRDELRQAQKVEALGRLAGGIAHDFNNMLMIVQSTLHLAIRRSESGSHVGRCLLEAEQATQRAAALTRQLLTFGRRQTVRPAVTALPALLRNLSPMLHGVLGGTVALEIVVPEETPRVVVDVAQIEQALVNLAMNARDAMPFGGSLRIAASTVDLDDERAEGLRLAPGPHVALDVVDTGIGLTAEARQHLFEPFFTTKPAGQGTGLGLATAYGAVRENRGAIEVTSEVGRGTTFRLLFPVAPDDAVADPAARHSAAGGAAPGTDREARPTVLPGDY